MNRLIKQMNDMNMNISKSHVDISKLGTDMSKMDIDDDETYSLYSIVDDFKYLNDCNIVYLDVPNLYCYKHFDDEDFIYNQFRFSPNILNYITNNNKNTYYEYVINYVIREGIIINFNKLCDTVDNNDNTTSAEELYCKLIYIYQYISSFHTLPSNYTLIDRLNTMPPDLLNWIGNVLKIIKKHININPDSKIYENSQIYLKELLYGMNLLICHVKMVLNHHLVRNLPIYSMCTKNIDKFFKHVNNLCVIMITCKLTIDGNI